MGRDQKEGSRIAQTRQAVHVHGENQGGHESDLYTELWHACAGPLAYVPRVGEKVFYFPQGHIEQVAAYTNQNSEVEMPIYNLYSKILCKVVYVNLKAEVTTDEVFAQITLLPETKRDAPRLEKGCSLPVPPKSHSSSFVKKLTASDTSTHGGFSVPKRHAEDCLPPLELSQQPPVQDLVATDLHGGQWHFRHIFRGQPKRHLLTSGWSTFVSSKKLVAGDACIFLRGQNGELCVGVRREAKLQTNATANVLSAHSMQHGILASAYHAVCTGTMFTVYYHPWTSPAEFIIPYDKYVKTTEIEYSLGARFKMIFEAEEGGEQRLAGTVVGNEDIDHIRWPDSDWRCLKVKWDIKSDVRTCPERLSPWNIELMECSKKKKTSIQHQQKKARVCNVPMPGFSSMVHDGLFRNAVGHSPQSHLGVLQGQESKGKGIIIESDAPRMRPRKNPGWKPTQPEFEDHLSFAMNDPFDQCHISSILFSGGNIGSSIPKGCPSTHAVQNKAKARRIFSVPNVNFSNSESSDRRALELRDQNDAPPIQQNCPGGYKLFGVNLYNNPPELPSPQVANSSDFECFSSVPLTSQSSVSGTIEVTDPSNSLSGSLSRRKCKKFCSVTNRSCTKVLKYGTALGRSIDLTKFNGYEELVCELDQMFDLKGSLINGTSGWHVAYTDDEGDMMLMGDYPWQEFQGMVRKMFICPKEAAES